MRDIEVQGSFAQNVLGFFSGKWWARCFCLCFFKKVFCFLWMNIVPIRSWMRRENISPSAPPYPPLPSRPPPPLPNAPPSLFDKVDFMNHNQSSVGSAAGTLVSVAKLAWFTQETDVQVAHGAGRVGTVCGTMVPVDWTWNANNGMICFRRSIPLPSVWRPWQTEWYVLGVPFHCQVCGGPDRLRDMFQAFHSIANCERPWQTEWYISGVPFHC